MAERAGSQAPQPVQHARGSGWVLALQVVASAIVAAILIMGPDIWALGEKIKGYLHRPPTSRPVVPPATEKLTAERVTAVRVAPSPKTAGAEPASPPNPKSPQMAQAPKTEVRAPTEVRPATAATPRSSAKPKRQAAPNQTTAPILLEPKVKSDPKAYFETLMRDGIQQYQSGWYGPALGRFRQAAQIMPNSAYAQLWIGRAALKAGRVAEARRALERTIALAPDSDAAREARTLLASSN